MARRMTAADAGELLFDQWIAAGDEGLSREATLAATELTDRQFRNGKEYLRKILTLDRAEPFSYDAVANVYRMNTHPEHVQRYYLSRLRIAAKQTLRLLSGTLVPLSKKGGDRQARRIVRDTRRQLEDMLDILDSNGVDVSDLESEYAELGA